MDHFSVLNYQGSKKNLIEFIHANTAGVLAPDETVLDIFAGTCSVGYSYKNSNPVYANDSEFYAYVISKALLGRRPEHPDTVLEQVKTLFDQNQKKHKPLYRDLEIVERELLSSGQTDSLIELYGRVPTIWDHDTFVPASHSGFELFTTYYSNSYFGVGQAMEIDSIRCAIEQFRDTELFCPLLTSLYYAMKECVFSKDGHMAQPLNPEKNKKKLLAQRNKSIYDNFTEKAREFFSPRFVDSCRQNRAFNLNFEDLLELPEIRDNVQFIYADPPYTDMQYSRYYHLLNIVSKYDYPDPARFGSQYTKGLYTNGRYQSKLSAKSTSLDTFSKLIAFSKEYHKNLAISFAYPKDTAKQKTDRYVMSIGDLVSRCSEHFGASAVEVVSQDYSHSNNRNSAPKKVLEYLILCRGR